MAKSNASEVDAVPEPAVDPASDAPPSGLEDRETNAQDDEMMVSYLDSALNRFSMQRDNKETLAFAGLAG